MLTSEEQSALIVAYKTAQRNEEKIIELLVGLIVKWLSVREETFSLFAKIVDNGGHVESSDIWFD